MLGHRLRSWPNIKPALGQRNCSAFRETTTDVTKSGVDTRQAGRRHCRIQKTGEYARLPPTPRHKAQKAMNYVSRGGGGGIPDTDPLAYINSWTPVPVMSTAQFASGQGEREVTYPDAGHGRQRPVKGHPSYSSISTLIWAQPRIDIEPI